MHTPHTLPRRSQLSPAQQRAWEAIRAAKVECASEVINGRCWIQRGTLYCKFDGTPSFIAGRYYGHFQKATLASLEKKGLIVIDYLSDSGICDSFSLVA